MEMAKPDELLGLTARWTAGARALENRREDRLFADPWAEALAGAEGAAWLAQRPPDSLLPMIIRTRFFDDFLQRITAQEGIHQVVLPAAGLDTRAFRLNWPAQTRFFELDQSAVLVHKAQVLGPAQPTCDRRAIGADLTFPWAEALIESGFEPRQPSLWLLEGFLFYLLNEAIAGLLDAVTALATAGSWVGFDCVNSAVLTSDLTRKWVEMQAAAGAPWLGVIDDPAAFLAERGWTASLTQAGAPDAHYGRWKLPVIPVTMPGMPHNWYVTAVKK